MSTTPTDWVKQNEWYGNPSLGYDCWMRLFNYGTRKIPVYVWGSPDGSDIHFTVSAGASSDLSYTGCFFPEKLTFEQVMEKLDAKTPIK